jgi:hypothetical protein
VELRVKFGERIKGLDNNVRRNMYIIYYSMKTIDRIQWYRQLGIQNIVGKGC